MGVSSFEVDGGGQPDRLVVNAGGRDPCRSHSMPGWRRLHMPELRMLAPGICSAALVGKRPTVGSAVARPSARVSDWLVTSGPGPAPALGGRKAGGGAS
jgi:hypothetical protein